MAEQYSSKGIMVATIIVAIVLTAVVVPFSMKGEKSAADAGSSDQAENRIQPVARFELAKAAPAAAAGPKDGATVFNSVCGACHNSGVAGAPKVGDKAAWAPRVAQGKEALYKSAIAGKSAMPQRVVLPICQMTKSRLPSITYWPRSSRRSDTQGKGGCGLPFLLTIQIRCHGSLCGHRYLDRRAVHKKRAPHGRPARAGFWRAVPELLQGVYFLTGSTAFAASAE